MTTTVDASQIRTEAGPLSTLLGPDGSNLATEEKLLSTTLGDGSDMVTYQPSIPNTINFSVKEALDETVDLTKKFGLTGDIDDDQTSSWNDLVEYVNSLPRGGEALLKGVYRISGETLPITSTLSLVGRSPSESALIFAAGNGLDLNLSASRPSNIGARLEKLSLVTMGGGTGLRFRMGGGGTQNCPNLFARDVWMGSYGKWLTGNDDGFEWDQAIVLGAPELKTTEVHLDDIFINGASSNGSYSGGLTSSSGIVSYNVTGLRITRPKIFLTGEDAISLHGQTEGLILTGFTVAAVRRGVAFYGMTNPCNNHVITSGHISCYERGVLSEDTGDTFNPIANSITDTFILERNETVTKDVPFVGVDVMWRGSILHGVTVQANGSAPSIEKTAFRLGRGYNKLIGCESRNMMHVLEVANYANHSHDSTVQIVGCHDVGTSGSFLHPNSVIGPNGSKMSGVGAGEESGFANSFVRTRLDGQPNFGFYNNTLRVGKDETYYLDVHTSPAGPSYDARIFWSGGNSDGSSGGADWILYGSRFRFAGNIAPFADNTNTLGTAALRYSATYSDRFYVGSGNAFLAAGAGIPSIGAYAGSLYLNDGGQIGRTLYVKETGTTGSTGWAPAQMRRSGPTESRPALTGTTGNEGIEYFDTTLLKPIWWTGTEWVDSTGTAA